MNVDRIKAGLEQTWQAIGADVLQASGSDSVPKDVVIEMVLDCNRYEDYGNLGEVDLEEFKGLPFEDKIAIAEETFTQEGYGY